jgi:hypothetical protein
MTVGVRHGCGAEIACAVNNRPIEFYEAGDDGQLQRSENFSIYEF